MIAYITVRSNVPDTDIKKFDTWYEKEHLVDALNGFGAVSASRKWSNDNPNSHIAIYEFQSLSNAKRILKSSALERLMNKFDLRWDSKIVRTREVVEVVQQIKNY
jgi:hypothetical protein